MAQEYYCGFRLKGNSTLQCEVVRASGQSEAKRIIEARYKGSDISWPHSPTSARKPPSWFKG